MKNILVIFIFSLMSHSLLAENLTFKILGKKEVYVKNNELSVFINKTCTKNSCLALKTFSNTTKLDCSKITFYNDKNPTNKICTTLLNGSIEIGFDEHENENSFCFFKDKSSVVADSLIHLCKE